MSLKKLEENQITIGNLAGLIGYWQGTATMLQYERDPKVIHEKLREAYEISTVWFKMRDQEGVNVDKVQAKIKESQK